MPEWWDAGVKKSMFLSAKGVRYFENIGFPAALLMQYDLHDWLP
jgi:hypothetical protein